MVDAFFRLRFVGFDVTVKLAHIILKLAPGSIEGIAQCHINIFMMVVVDHNLMPRYADINADVVLLALVMVLVRLFHHHTAGGDVIEELVEFPRLVPYAFFKSFRRSNVADSNLQWNLHGFFL